MFSIFNLFSPHAKLKPHGCPLRKVLLIAIVEEIESQRIQVSSGIHIARKM